MSLAEYRVHDGVDVGLVDPLADRLLRLLTLFGGRVLIISGRRSWAEQQVLWEQYLAGGPLAARPGTSLHERGAAADLRIVDSSVTWREVHLAASTYGLAFPIAGENWHVQADPAWVEPEEHDMTPQEMAHLLGCTLDGFGRAVVPVGDKVYPLANVIAFVLDEVQRDDLLVQRIKDKLDS
jgi:hypothetical protein